MPRRALPDSATITIAGDLLSRQMDDELVILNLRDGVYYGLDQVGARVWRLLEKPVTVAALRESILAEYDVERSRWENDMQRLLRDLVEKGLAIVSEPS